MTSLVNSGCINGLDSRGISERMTLETPRICTSGSPYLRLYKLSRGDGFVAVAGYEVGSTGYVHHQDRVVGSRERKGYLRHLRELEVLLYYIRAFW